MRRLIAILVLLIALPLPASAAARFLVACSTTCTITAADTSLWSATAGGAGGASVPGASDTVTVDITNGVATLGAAYNPSWSSLTLTSGTFSAATNNNSPTLGSFTGNCGAAGTLLMGDGTWTVSGSGVVWNVAVAGLNLTPGNSVIKFTNSTASQKTIRLGNTYHNVWLSGTGTGIFLFAGLTTGSVVNDLKVDADLAFQINAATDLTVASFSPQGTSGHLVTFSSPAGVPGRLTKSSAGVSTLSYLALSHLNGVPGGAWRCDSTCTHANDMVSGGWWFATEPLNHLGARLGF